MVILIVIFSTFPYLSIFPYRTIFGKKTKQKKPILFRWRVAVVYWLRQKTLDREVLGSNLHYGDHFTGTIHLDQSLEQKSWKTLDWHFCICCNPANGGVDFEELSAFKIQLHGIE